MASELLLIEDVEELGLKGEIVKVKPGYARNFLIPQQKAVVADKRTLRMQERLKEERRKKAEDDRLEAEGVASKVNGKVYEVVVKVDPEGHMYGSVSVADICQLALEHDGVELCKKSVLLKAPIRQVGTHEVALKLKENVTATIHVQVTAENEVKGA
ncbi:MAG: putative ribosomal protein [Chlamydiales bacterium]|jgi:large subunit ribosomal protein L9|nr:putative ribosomal protein [Chlamydiales bacterium]